MTVRVRRGKAMSRWGVKVRLGALLLAAAGAWWLSSAGGPVPAPPVLSSAIAAPKDFSVAKERRTEIVDVAERLSPAIVSIGASRTGYMVSPFMDFFSDFAAFPYKEKMPYLGSGVIVDPDGYIVTNQHVIDGAEDIFVTLTDGREFPAKLLDTNSVMDIALLKIDAKDLKHVPMGNSDDLMVGEWVIAMGNPFGNLIGDPTPTVTVGVVSAMRRSFRAAGQAGRVYDDIIQTDAAINPGNSGGALINAAGELVGINTFIVSRTGGSVGLGFAIPVNHVRQVVEEILTYGKLRQRLVDFRALNANPRLARMVGAKAEEGAVVSEMIRGGPADSSGLKLGDVVVQVDGRKVRDATELRTLWTRPVGTKVKLVVDREGKPVEVEYPVTAVSQE